MVRLRHGGTSTGSNNVIRRTHGVAGFDATTPENAVYGGAANPAPVDSTQPGPGSVGPGTIQPGVVGSDELAEGAVSITSLASSIRPPVVVSSTPTLPDTAWPVGSYCVVSSTKVLYRNDADVWVVASPTDALTVGQVTAGVISAGAVSTDQLAAGAVTTSKLALSDEYGTTVLNASGFGPAWASYIAGGLYNCLFSTSTVVDPLPDGRTANLAYWTVTKTSLPTCKVVTDTGAPSGRAVEMKVDAISTDTLKLVSDKVPVQAGRRYVPWGIFDSNGADTNLKWVAVAKFYFYAADKTTLIGSGTTVGTTSNLGLRSWSTGVYTWVDDPVAAPATAHWVSVEVIFSQEIISGTPSVDSTHYLRVGALGLWPVAVPRTVYGDGDLTINSGAYRTVNGDGLSTSAYFYGLTNVDTADEGVSAGVVFGSAADANLYRNGASQVRTSGDLIATGGCLVTVVVSSAPTGTTPFAGSTEYNGGMCVYSPSGRLYFKYSGAWHYCAQDAGFEVPSWERTCPCCLEPLLPGDDLIGQGDREIEDGALHGLWKHLRCAGKPLLSEASDAYWSVRNDSRETADGRSSVARSLRWIRERSRRGARAVGRSIKMR
jgi:hypothetical protein